MNPISRSDDDKLDVDENSAADDADEPNDFDQFSPTSADDAAWDVFLADDDERDPLPEEGDFWDDAPLDD